MRPFSNRELHQYTSQVQFTVEDGTMKGAILETSSPCEQEQMVDPGQALLFWQQLRSDQRDKVFKDKATDNFSLSLASTECATGLLRSLARASRGVLWF